MVVALTVTPALALLLLARAPLRSSEPPLVRWLQRGYTALAAPRHPQAARGDPRRRATLVAGLRGRAATSASRSSRRSRSATSSMHWVDAAGHVATRRSADHRPRASRDLRAIPGVRNFGSHIGQAFLGEEIVGVNFGENWISRRPERRLRQDARPRSRQVVDGYPGLFRERADLPQRADRRGAHRRRASRSSCASSATT